jgi:hypothetical protein
MKEIVARNRISGIELKDSYLGNDIDFENCVFEIRMTAFMKEKGGVK